MNQIAIMKNRWDYTLSVIKGMIADCYTEIEHGHHDRVKEKLKSIKEKYLDDDILNMFPNRA